MDDPLPNRTKYRLLLRGVHTGRCPVCSEVDRSDPQLTAGQTATLRAIAGFVPMLWRRDRAVTWKGRNGAPRQAGKVRVPGNRKGIRLSGWGHERARRNRRLSPGQCVVILFRKQRFRTGRAPLRWRARNTTKNECPFRSAPGQTARVMRGSAASLPLGRRLWDQWREGQLPAL